MRQLMKWLGIFLAAILIIILIGVAALPIIFPPEKIKAFAAAKISELLQREVKIDKASFNLFSGFKLEGISIGNRSGFTRQPFIQADSIVLSYAFWPLFSRQIIVHEVALVRPSVLIEKNARGEFNFSDLTAARPSPAKKTAGATPAKMPFNLFVTQFSIRHGQLVYYDRPAGSMNEVKNINFDLSGFELALIKPVDLKFSADLIYQGKSVPVVLGGKINVDISQGTISASPLNFSIAGESATASFSTGGGKISPTIDFSISSNQLSLDPLLAIFASASGAAKTKPQPGELTRSINKLAAAIPSNLTVNGQVNISQLSFLKFKVDKTVLALNLSRKRVSANIKEIRFYDGTLSGKALIDLNVPGLGYSVQSLSLQGFNSTPFTNALVETFLTKLPNYHGLTDKVYGTLGAQVSLSGSGVEPKEAMANASASGSFSIKNGELKKIKSLAEIGKTLRSNTLQGDIKFGNLSSDFGYKGQVVTAKNFKLDNPDFTVGFNGGIDLGRQLWVPGNRLDLKISPSATPSLPREFNLFKDANGWLNLTFEITGQLKKPLPKPILTQPIEKVVGKIKVQIEAKKVEIQSAAEAARASAEAEAKAKAEAEKERLKQQAKEQLKQLLPKF